jgi:putative endonuclease
MPADPDAVRRRRTLVAGLRAERIAVVWLALKGYRILARRYRVHGGEIDIVARRGRTIAVVEVKARPTLDEARTAVTATKHRRIERAASVWLSRNPWATCLDVRGDMVLVAPWRRPHHLADALTLRI